MNPKSSVNWDDVAPVKRIPKAIIARRERAKRMQALATQVERAMTRGAYEHFLGLYERSLDAVAFYEGGSPRAG